MTSIPTWLVLFFHFALPMHYFDTGVFHDDLELAGIEAYHSPAWPGYDFDLGFDWHKGNNALRLALTWGTWRMENAEGARLALFEEGYVAGEVGYKRRFGRHFALIADSGLGLTGTDYNIHSDQWHGRARYLSFLATPEVAAELAFKRFGFGVAGRYYLPFGNLGDDYCGDMGPAEQGGLDLNHFALRIYLIVNATNKD